MDNSNLSEEQKKMLREVLMILASVDRLFEKTPSAEAKDLVGEAIERLTKLVANR